MTEFEAEVYKHFSKRGDVYRNGWPDFLVVGNDGVGFALECKQGKDRLSDEQKKMHKALSAFGIDVAVVRPEDVTEHINYKGPMVMTSKSLTQLKREVKTMMWDFEYRHGQLLGLRREIDELLVAFDITEEGYDLREQMEILDNIEQRELRQGPHPSDVKKMIVEEAS